MALTPAELLALYQILELPMFPQQTTVYPDGSVGRLHDLTNQQWAIPTLINNHLTTYIYPDANLTTELAGLCDDWIALGTDTTRIEGGAIGCISGVDYSTADEREEIRRQVLVLVPFYRFHEQMLHRQTCIEVIR